MGVESVGIHLIIVGRLLNFKRRRARLYFYWSRYLAALYHSGQICSVTTGSLLESFRRLLKQRWGYPLLLGWEITSVRAKSALIFWQNLTPAIKRTNITNYKMEGISVGGQEHIPIEVAILAAFVCYQYKFLSRVENKNLYRLSIRCISKREAM